MKLTTTVKLLPTDEQSNALLETVERVNAACDWLAGRAFEAKEANRFRLHALHYRDLRERFGLPSQTAVRAIAKVCDAYKRDRSRRPSFRPRGAVAYDRRNLSIKGDRVSILTLAGRAVMPFASGNGRLDGAHRESDLVFRNGKWLLYVLADVPDIPPAEPSGWLGVDMGIRNIAFDSDGEAHSGAGVEAVRGRLFRLRSRLQSAGTKSAKRHLKRVSRREARFRADTNHRISKRIVAKAKGTGRGIAVEDLTGIRGRTTVRRGQRAMHCGWSFNQLRSFLSYKCGLAGVLMVAVDPRGTSRTCPRCGHADRANRRSQSEFLCESCGFADHADHVGAVNVARRAAVNRPIVTVGSEHETSPIRLQAACFSWR